MDIGPDANLAQSRDAFPEGMPEGWSGSGPRGQGYAPPHSGGFGVSLDRDGRRWIVIEFSAILLT